MRVALDEDRGRDDVDSRLLLELLDEDGGLVGDLAVGSGEDLLADELLDDRARALVGELVFGVERRRRR